MWELTGIKYKWFSIYVFSENISVAKTVSQPCIPKTNKWWGREWRSSRGDSDGKLFFSYVKNEGNVEEKSMTVLRAGSRKFWKTQCKSYEVNQESVEKKLDKVCFMNGIKKVSREIKVFFISAIKKVLKKNQMMSVRGIKKVLKGIRCNLWAESRKCWKESDVVCERNQEIVEKNQSLSIERNQESVERNQMKSVSGIKKLLKKFRQGLSDECINFLK